jgi:hypothetical protein
MKPCKVSPDLTDISGWNADSFSLGEKIRMRANRGPAAGEISESAAALAGPAGWPMTGYAQVRQFRGLQPRHQKAVS